MKGSNFKMQKKLISAVQNKNIRIVKELLAQKCNPDGFVNPKRMTPLMYSACHADSACLSILIDFKANVNQQNRNGKTALMIACLNKRKPNICTLLSAKADPNLKCFQHGRNALMFAMRNNKMMDILTLLIQSGAKVNQVDHYGKTALDVFLDTHRVLYGSHRYLDILVEKNGHINRDSCWRYYGFYAKQKILQRKLDILGSSKVNTDIIFYIKTFIK